jgi:hypothetical protein
MDRFGHDLGCLLRVLTWTLAAVTVALAVLAALVIAGVI